MTWVGISPDKNSFGTTEQDQYIVFTSTYGKGDKAVQSACLDENVKMFNTYNYTLYAPDNEAMQIAYANGLPRWSEIQEHYKSLPHPIIRRNPLPVQCLRRNAVYLKELPMRSLVWWQAEAVS